MPVPMDGPERELLDEALFLVEEASPLERLHESATAVVQEPTVSKVPVVAEPPPQVQVVLPPETIDEGERRGVSPSVEHPDTGGLTPRRSPVVIDVNAGLTLPAYDRAVLTPEHLLLSGDEPFLIDVMLLSAPRHGVLLRDGFALTGGDVFTQEDVDHGRLSYRHEGDGVEDSFTFATPDGEVPPTEFVVRALRLRCAPEATLGPVAEPWTQALTVGELFGAAVAVVRAEGQGTWQYSCDDGATWADLGAAYHGRARLLPTAARVRFMPGRDGAGLVQLGARTWDGVGEKEVVNLAAHRAVGADTGFGARVHVRTWRLGG